MTQKVNPLQASAVPPSAAPASARNRRRVIGLGWGLDIGVAPHDDDLKTCDGIPDTRCLAFKVAIVLHGGFSFGIALWATTDSLAETGY